MALIRTVVFLAVALAVSSSAAAFCCWYEVEGKCQTRAVVGDWCAESARRCTGVCNGVWYNKGKPTSTKTPSNDAPRDRRQPKQQVRQENHRPNEDPMSPHREQSPPANAPSGPSREPTRPSRPWTGVPSAGNPFRKHKLFINPTYTDNIDQSVRTAKSDAEKLNLMKMRKTPTAYWIDVRKKARRGATTLDSVDGILKNAAGRKTPPLVTFIVYNLPNRDCAAEASNGELCCGGKTEKGQCDFLDESSTGNCQAGLKKYREEYIDQIAASIKQYCGKVPLALIIEPDSLPNFVTNIDNRKCGAKSTQASYRNGIPYASNTLAKACSRATQYLDAAHGGWLGWDDNREGFMEEVKKMGIAKNLRGFALNVANYQPVGTMCPEVGYCLNGKNADDPCCKDPCKLSTQFNPANCEMNYAAALSETMKRGIPGFNPKMIIDTGRNGKSPRENCSNWCNVRGAGVGLLPTTNVPHPELIDAFLWLKTPGESDGCTKELPDGKTCARFDLKCGSSDSIGSKPGEPRAPTAGGWFDYQVKMLARNAEMGSN